MLSDDFIKGGADVKAGYGIGCIMGVVFWVDEVVLIEHENRIDRIRVHPRHPRNPCSISAAPVHALGEGKLKFKEHIDQDQDFPGFIFIKSKKDSIPFQSVFLFSFKGFEEPAFRYSLSTAFTRCPIVMIPPSSSA